MFGLISQISLSIYTPLRLEGEDSMCLVFMAQTSTIFTAFIGTNFFVLKSIGLGNSIL